MSITIYVGGSSTELERNKAVSAWLGKHNGVVVVSTWARHVEQVGEANPDGMSEEDRFAYSYSDLRELGMSDWLLLLMPPRGVVSAGAFLEFGYALAKGIKICVSGPGQSASIFTSMADVSVVSDEHAVRFFQKLL